MSTSKLDKELANLQRLLKETEQAAAEDGATHDDMLVHKQARELYIQRAMKFAKSNLDKFITENEKCKKLKEKTALASQSDAPVLITGESGTGKEIIAKALHGARTGQFISINCAAFTESLLESELFGHVKGAFTGANNDRPGLFRAASDGTLFLDEIGDMPIHLQVRLLRVLQEKEIRPVGSDDSSIKVNCRIVTATNINLLDAVKNGKFRLDLYYRIATLKLHIPPLRERTDDIPELISHYDPDGLLPQTVIDTLKTMQFDGNVRQLLMFIERYKVFGTLNDE